MKAGYDIGCKVSFVEILFQILRVIGIKSIVELVVDLSFETSV